MCRRACVCKRVGARGGRGGGMRGSTVHDMKKNDVMARKTVHPAVDRGKGGLQRVCSNTQRRERSYAPRTTASCRAPNRALCAEKSAGGRLWTRTTVSERTSSTGRMVASFASTPPPTTSGCSEDASVAMLGRELEPPTFVRNPVAQPPHEQWHNLLRIALLFSNLQ